MRFFLGYNERQAMLSAENEFPRRGMKIAENRKEFHMITLERTSVMNLENAIRGARNPMNQIITAMKTESMCWDPMIWIWQSA